MVLAASHKVIENKDNTSPRKIKTISKSSFPVLGVRLCYMLLHC